VCIEWHACIEALLKGEIPEPKTAWIKNILPNYEFHKNFLGKGKLQIEVPFLKRFGKNLWIVGKADGVFEYGNKRILIEHKTTSNLDQFYWHRAMLSTQSILYSWALQCTDVAYDVLNKKDWSLHQKFFIAPSMYDLEWKVIFAYEQLIRGLLGEKNPCDYCAKYYGQQCPYYNWCWTDSKINLIQLNPEELFPEIDGEVKIKILQILESEKNPF
jgi:hypothetical protein